MEIINKSTSIGSTETEIRQETFLPILCSSNTLKQDFFLKAFPEALFTADYFDEQAISREIEKTSGKGITYAAMISREKVEKTRQALRDVSFDKPPIFFSTDSVMLIPDAPGSSQLRTLNRDDELREDWMMQEINKSGELVLTAGISAAGLEGAVHTTQIYIRVPVNKATLRIDYKNLQDIIDSSRRAEVGVIRPTIDSNNQIDYQMDPLMDIDATVADQLIPFMSGAQPEALETVFEAAILDSKVTPLLEDLISQFPFNTFHYVSPPISPLYAGGDCHFFTRALANHLNHRTDRLRDYSIGLWHAQKPYLSQGHSNIIIHGSSVIGVADAGITFPRLMPYSSTFPFHPMPTEAGKEAFIAEVNTDNGNTLALVLKKIDEPKSAILPLERIITPTELQEHLSTVLPQLITARNGELRWENHDKFGRKSNALYLDAEGKIKVIIDNEIRYYNLLSSEADEAAEKDLAFFGINLLDMHCAYTNWRTYVTNNQHSS